MLISVCSIVNIQLRKLFLEVIMSGIYIYNDTYYVQNDVQNATYWIVINKSLNETANGNFKNTLIQ